MINKTVSLPDIEEELAVSVIPLLKKLETLSEKIENAPEEKEENHAEDYQQLCLETEQLLEKRFPTPISLNPLNILELSPQEFIARLYAELAKSNMFQLEVLDL
ncbi:MAG: hypothetical protein K2P93_00195 [Alphaproteobacteria bacterium]|nr:hypothetical protein [Alphaproteobacteria bacterium]